MKIVKLILAEPGSVTETIEALQALQNGESVVVNVNDGKLTLIRENGVLLIRKMRVTFNGLEMNQFSEIINKG